MAQEVCDTQDKTSIVYRVREANKYSPIKHAVILGLTLKMKAAWLK